MPPKKQDSSIMLPHGRKRTISPGFFSDPDVVSLEPLDRLLFIGIWCFADKAGRLLDKPIDLKMRLFPADNFDVDAGLERLAERRLVYRYQVGRPRLRVLAMKEDKWSAIQRINPHEPESALPAPPGKLLAKTSARGFSKPPTVYVDVLVDPIEADTPVLRSGPSGPAGPSGPSGSSGPSEVPSGDVSEHRNRSDEEELWIELEACRIAHCIEVGLEPGESKPRSPKAINAMLLGAVTHLGFVDRQTSAGVITRWDQLGDLYEQVYLAGEFGKDGTPPWPIELFCSHGVLDNAKRKAAKLLPSTSEAA